MDKQDLLELLDTNLTYQQIAEKLGYKTSQTTVRYIKKYGITPNRKPGKTLSIVNGKKQCKTCSQVLSIDLFGKTSKNNPKSSCKNCETKIAKQARKVGKQLAVDYKGGKCEICKYSKCIASLEFHHLDPLTKENNVSRLLTSTAHRLTDRAKQELDKCILVCANCHGELHYEN